MPIKELVRRYILENFIFSDDENLPEDASFLEEGIVDSTGVLQLVMFAETTFGIDVRDEEVVPENFDSLRQLTHYIQVKTGQIQADGNGHP